MPLRRGIVDRAPAASRASPTFRPIRCNDAIAARLQIVGAVDPRRLGDRSSMACRVDPSLGDALAAGAIEFVDICTPTATHRALVLDAPSSAACTSSAKSRWRSLPPARASWPTAARAANRVLFPCHQYRQNPAWLAMRRWIDDGAIGRWHLAEFHVYRGEADRGRRRRCRSAVAGRKTDSLGGVLLDHGTHLLYLLLDVGGMPVSGRGASVAPRPPAATTSRTPRICCSTTATASRR